MATIQQRGNKWHVRVRRKGIKTQTATFTTRTKAERWARTIEAKCDLLQEAPTSVSSSPLSSPFPDLGSLLHDYQLYRTASKKGAYPETKRIECLRRSTLCTYPLQELRKSHFATYRDQRRADGKTDDTIRRELDIVSSAITWARTDRDMEWLPNHARVICKTLRPPSLCQRQRRPSWRELRRLLKAAREMGQRGSLIELVICLAIRTAMRRSEIASLEWSQVDLKARLIVLTDTKNGYGRIVPLSSRAVRILARLHSDEISGSVFTMRSDSITQAFSRACSRAGLEDLRFHDLRHEATSRFFEIGLNTMEVASITGHRTLQMLKRYTHLRAAGLARKLG